jgi:hypothetical protein
MEFVELGIASFCGHEVVAWFRKTNAVRSGVSAVADTYSDLSTGVIYLANGNS